MQELVAARLFVGFADLGRSVAQPVERAEKTAVGLVRPPHVPAAPPARLAEPIEPSVIADSEARVRLGVVSCELAEARPAVEETGPSGDDGGHGIPPTVVGLGEGVTKCPEGIGWLGVEHGLGNTSGREADGKIGHALNVSGLLEVDVRSTGTILAVTDAAAPPGDAPNGDKPPDERPKVTPSTTLLLARHAVTAETGSMLSGRKPGIDLSEKGREQAASLGERLKVLPIAAVYASPIERTMQTAEAVAVHHGLEVHELSGVLEADYGDWTGGKLGDLAKEDLWRTVQRAPSRARFPAGESLAEMQVRMVAALERVVVDHPGDVVVVVSHADPIKSAIAHYNGMHLDHFQRIVVSPASVTVFQLSAYGASMVKCNDTGSLDELVAHRTEDAPATEHDHEHEHDHEQSGEQ